MIVSCCSDVGQASVKFLTSKSAYKLPSPNEHSTAMEILLPAKASMDKSVGIDTDRDTTYFSELSRLFLCMVKIEIGETEMFSVETGGAMSNCFGKSITVSVIGKSAGW